MNKFVYIVCFLFFLPIANIYAQDTVNIKGNRYEVVQGLTDTIRKENSVYIIKYIVKSEKADTFYRNGSNTGSIYLGILNKDTLNVNNEHYEFIKGVPDTLKSGSNLYIIKYIEKPEMAHKLRVNGKIYIVVLVLATIFVGIFIYLIILDRKISRIEKENLK